MQNNRKGLIFKGMEILQVKRFCSDIYIPGCSDPSRNIYISSLNTFILSSGTFGFFRWNFLRIYFLSIRATVICDKQSVVLQVSFENMSDYRLL